MSLLLSLLFFSAFIRVLYMYRRWAFLDLRFHLNISSLRFDFSFVADKIALIGVMLVLLISGCVFLFSYKYIERDHNERRFALILGAFVVSILFLLTRNSIPFLLLGWDGLGITSFLLIIYYDRKGNNRSGMITFCVNRLGDAIIIGNLIFFVTYGHMSIGFYLGVHLCAIYMIVAITKRAQYPFSIWLPLAMDAPTPVSALVHRRTLVTAGLFLLARLIPESLNIYLCFIGGLTLCVGGVCAVFSSDLKKLIANSTLSNLGLIIITLAISNKTLILFHLFTHALFKAGLFMVAGAILVNRFGAQDGRSVYNSLRLSPVISSYIRAFFISSTGIFFLSTFYSKHHIVIICQSFRINSIGIIIIFLGVFLRTLYRLRFSFIMIGDKRITVINAEIPSEIKWAVFILASCSVIYGNQYNMSFIYSTFSYEAPILLVIILRLLAFIVHNKSNINRVLFSSMFYLDTIIDVLYKKTSLNKVRLIDFGFGSLESREYQKIFYLRLRSYNNWVNISVLLLFTFLIVLFI